MTCKKCVKIITGLIVGAIVLGAGAVFGINAYVKEVTAKRILTPQEAAELSDVDCILVLGCGIHADGSPSRMLADRLSRSVELYELQAAPKLLMSGDHGSAEYNEVATMREYALERGVPSEDIFMDHAGFSTYDSMYRAKEVFGADKIIIVTQDYHLYRAIYIAQELGMEAYGVAAKDVRYSGQTMRDIREILARVKDFFFTMFKPKPTYLGEAIPVSGDGNITVD